MEHYTFEKMDKEILSPTIARRIIAGENAMVAQVFLVKGAVVPEHKHESEQITYILEGALLFEIDGKEILWEKGRYSASLRGSHTKPLRSKTRLIWTSSAPFVRTG